MDQYESLENATSVLLGPYRISFAAVLPGEWISVQALALRPLNLKKSMPNLYGLVERAGWPITRLDLFDYTSSNGFRTAVAPWGQWLAIAFGDYLYLVSIRSNQVHAYPLQGYFGRLERLPSHLLVADACRRLCIDASPHVQWSLDLGIGGVVFAVHGDVVVGEAEIDPAGGWVPFKVDLRTGERLD